MKKIEGNEWGRFRVLFWEGRGRHSDQSKVVGTVGRERDVVKLR